MYFACFEQHIRPKEQPSTSIDVQNTDCLHKINKKRWTGSLLLHETQIVSKEKVLYFSTSN